MTDQQLEKTLWATADKLRNNMDAAEYKHVVLGLIFLKYISDAFEERRSKLEKEVQDPKSDWFVKEPEARYGVLEDKDEYRAENIFFVPPTARWSYIQDRAKLPEIGKVIDDAMDAIEKENPTLKGVLSKQYARPSLDKVRLGELVDLIAKIGLGGKDHRSKDILGRVYEYFLGQFADAEGKKGGQFYTPRSIVQLLVEMLEPYKGRIYDGCCGSGGMFSQSEKFIEAHGGKRGDISIYGQESNPTTVKLAQMNMAIRGIEAHIALGDTFHNDQHKDLKADYIIANPPFNISDYGQESLKEDYRWKYGVPPSGNANYAWLQHFISKLSTTGTAGIVLANGSMTSNSGGEGEIRKNLIEAKLIDCMVSLPGQLFFNTQIPACLWFLSRDKKTSKYRNREKEILFIDARNLGTMISRKNKELSDDDIRKIAETYHNWRNKDGGYADIPGYCKSEFIEEVAKNGYVLTPGRYVGNEDFEEDSEGFDSKMKLLTEELNEQFTLSRKLEKEIKENLEKIEY